MSNASSATGFKEYKQGTMVLVNTTGEQGEIWEALHNMNICSVFVDGERKCRYFKLDEVTILEESDESQNHKAKGKI